MASFFVRFLSLLAVFFVAFSSANISGAHAFLKVSLKQDDQKQLYSEDIENLQKIYTQVKKELPGGKFSSVQLKKIQLLERGMGRKIKTLDIVKTPTQKTQALIVYRKSVQSIEIYVKSLPPKSIRTPNIGSVASSTSNTGSQSNPSVQDSKPETWIPDETAKLLYYSDAFEGKNTSSGDKFSQSKFSAANCLADLNQFIQVRSGNESIIVKVNDRPNCMKHPDIVDLSKTAFSELGRIESGVLQGSFKKLGTIPGDYTKQYIDENVFSTLGIRLEKNIPNMYLPNDTLSITGDIVTGGSESLVYVVAPSGKIVSYGKESLIPGKFQFEIPLTEIGRYDFVVAAGRSFQAAKPTPLYVIDPSAISGKIEFLDTSTIPTISNISTERSEASDLSPTHLVRVSNPTENILSEITISANGQEWTRRGFGILAFDPLEFKNISSGTSSKVTLKSAKTSTPFSMDVNSSKKTSIEGQYILAPNYSTTEEIDYVSSLENGVYKMVLKGESNLPINSTVYIMTPSGSVETVSFNERFVANGTLNKTVGAYFEYKMTDPGVYLVEVNYTNGFAVVIEPVTVGKTLAILPNEYDLQNKAIETNMSYARSQILKDINSIRSRAGLPLVSFDAKLQQIADAKSNDMLSNSYVGHKDSKGDYALGLANRLGIDIVGAIGENVAGGTVGAQYLQAGLSLSPGHRLNMLGKKWSKVGISLATKGDRVYVVEIFGE